MTTIRCCILALSLLAAAVSLPAQGRTICTVVADARDGRVLVEEGNCRTRVTPASTFKIALP
jgi:beta-lactamase class D